MIKKRELTTAENTLNTMAKVVLILGIIASVFVFFTSCIAWDYSVISNEIEGIDGINWMGFPSLIYCIMATLIAWSVLSVIVEISVNIRDSGKQENDWQKEFAIAQISGQKEKAKEIFYRAVLESEEFRKVIRGGNSAYHQTCIDELNKKFEPYLKAIGEETFRYEENDEIFKVFN